MPLANPNQNPDGAEAPEQQQQALNQNGGEIMSQQPRIGQVRNNINEILAALNLEREERINSHHDVENNLQNQRARILQNQRVIRQLQQEQAAENASLREYEESFAAHVSDMEALQRQIEALQRLRSDINPQE